MGFPSRLEAHEETRAGRMLAAGDVRVTVTDAESKEHVTVRFKAMLDNRDGRAGEGKRWLRVPLEEATHIFIEVPNASGDFPDKIGTFYPKTGRWYADRYADLVRVGAATVAAEWLNGQENQLFRCQEESYCGRCGRTLTDPESIDKGIGPECNRQETSSKHQTKQKMSAEEKGEAQDVINQLADMTSQQQAMVERALEMWRSQERQSTRR